MPMQYRYLTRGRAQLHHIKIRGVFVRYLFKGYASRISQPQLSKTIEKHLRHILQTLNKHKKTPPEYGGVLYYTITRCIIGTLVYNLPHTPAEKWYHLLPDLQSYLQ